jgi:UDP-glucose 4-epimerase
MRQLVPSFDGVVHLAGLLGTSELVDDPAAAVDTNIIGALNVFQGCRTAVTLGRPISCVHITVGNHFMDNPYAITKSTSERFARMFNVEHDTDIRVVRVLNAYGSHQTHQPVRKIVPTFVRAALSGEPIRIYGDGEQVMDMIDVRDVAKILVDALLAPSIDGLLSAGTGRHLTVNEIARLIIEAAHSQSDIVHVPMRAGEPERSVVVGDPSSLDCLGVGGDSLIPFEVGIAHTVSWYADNRSFLGLDEYSAT